MNDERPVNPRSDLVPLPANAPKPLSVWKHYKGAIYQVLGVVRSSENHSEFLVVYTALHPSRYQYVPWCRPLSMWYELIPLAGVRRFTPFSGSR